MKAEVLPEEVRQAVKALCGDYDRRQAEIQKGNLPPKVIANYMMINAAIDEAIASCCEEGVRAEMRKDIGSGVGHRFSKLFYLSVNTYKDRKSKSKAAIAKALLLM
ncbi:MAG: hypothetical protein MJ078_05770 [Clostridia bacterium]|nr:hypothetical protein [Clostridia bacterium]